MGPILIFDKSFLQSLNVDEAVWLDMFFISNITPLFFVETLADLEKKVHRGRTPEDVVGNLALKTPDLSSKPNVHHATLLLGELTGSAVIDMRFGRPIISRGRHTELGGKSGVVFEPSPEEEAFERWERGEFLDLERQRAKAWRRALNLIPVQRQRELFSGWLGQAKPGTLAEIKAAVDNVIDDEDPEKMLRLGTTLLGFDGGSQELIVTRWKSCGAPAIRDFAPYFRHVFGVDLFFYLGLAADLISDRRTNRIDIAYLYYLPFCMVFVSSDKLHAATVPLFMNERQSFVFGPHLKEDFSALDHHYATLPEETKERGLFHFASAPPHDTRFLVTKLWDRHLVKGWRESRTPRNSSRDTKRDKELIGRIQRYVKAPSTSPGTDHGDSDASDYLIITRRVSRRKGKWRRFPSEIDRGDLLS